MWKHIFWMNHFQCAVTVDVLGFHWLLKYCWWENENRRDFFPGGSFPNSMGTIGRPQSHTVSCVPTNSITHVLLMVQSTEQGAFISFSCIIYKWWQGFHKVSTSHQVNTKWIRREETGSVVHRHICCCPLTAFKTQVTQEERLTLWAGVRKCTGLTLRGQFTELMVQP